MDNGALAESGARQVESLNAPMHPGAPTLVVRDLDRVAVYYEERIGLSRIDADSDTVRLGAGGVVLLVLRKRQSAEQEPPGLAGLYHTAFLVPSRAELGAWLRKAIETQLPFDGAADHLVSSRYTSLTRRAMASRSTPTVPAADGSGTTRLLRCATPSSTLRASSPTAPS